jgi:hypothetical protein
MAIYVKSAQQDLLKNNTFYDQIIITKIQTLNPRGIAQKVKRLIGINAHYTSVYARPPKKKNVDNPPQIRVSKSV